MGKRRVFNGSAVSAAPEQVTRPPEPLAVASSAARWTPPKYLTVAEIAALLRVSKMTVYRLVHTGALESIRIGRSFRIPEPAVRDYLGGQVTTLAAATVDARERLRQAGHAARAMPLGDPDDWIHIAALAGATAEEIAATGRVPVGHVRQVLNANGAQR